MEDRIPHTSRKGLRWCALVLIWLCSVLLFCAPAVFQNKVIAPIDCITNFLLPFADQPLEEVYNHCGSDGVSQYVPYRWAMKESLKQDGYIGWNPYTYNGSALPENSMLSPGDLSHALYNILPFYDAWNWSIILHFFIAGCGMLVLMRYFKLPMWAALLAAISYAFYSQFIVCLYFRWMGSMMWAPFLVWALLKYKQYVINVPAIIFMALAWRSGHLQSCVFIFVLVALIWFAEITTKKNRKYDIKEVCRITLSNFLTGTIGALLSLDVFVDTLPRMEGCKPVLFSWGINNVPAFITALFPTCLGLPQTLDIGSALNTSFANTMFGGSIMFILAILACFNNRAPKAAKFIFIGCMLAVCTPLNSYLYCRGTVVMALGMAWLAVWQLHDLTLHSFNSNYWKRIGYAILAILICWLLASIAIVCFKNQLADILTNSMASHVSANRAGREAWYITRIDRFLSQIVIWDWRNLFLSCSLLLCIVFCYNIKPNNRNTPWIAGIIALSFAELIVYSHTWLTYSDKPKGPYIYEAPEWLAEVKEHVKDGSVLVHNPTGDGRFLCNNHLSSFNVRLANGYETIQPQYLHCQNIKIHDTKEYAAAAISHILSQTTWVDRHYPKWKLVMIAKDFKLYQNPDYRGRYFINNEIPIKENWKTYNRIHLTIPPHSNNLTILESYHKGWKASIDGQDVQITRTARGGMYLNVPSSEKAYDLQLEFRMPYREYYYTIMLLTAIGLGFVFFKQKRNPIPLST